MTETPRPTVAVEPEPAAEPSPQPPTRAQPVGLPPRLRQQLRAHAATRYRRT